MVGGTLAATKGTFHLSRTAETLPHVANEIARAWFDDVVRASSKYAEKGGDPYSGLVWPPGAREAFLGDIRPLEMGSDHEVFEEAAFAVPMVYFHDYPDVTIHTNKDQPENLDASKLGRVAYMGAGIAWTLAALPDSEAARLLVLAGADGEARVAWARARGDEAPLAEEQQVESGVAALKSVAALWDVPPAKLRAEEERLRRMAAPALSAANPDAKRDDRVPVRNPEIRGPLDVYYFSFLEAAGVDASGAALLKRDGGDVLAYEAFNLADGKRSVSEIRDALTGLYELVRLSEVSEYLDLLAKAGAVTFRR
jgi:hypothetical protein